MAEQKNLRLSVENFGPIREGTVELKPLTIFIGPNNSGKSYMATLVYAILDSFLTGQRSPYLDLRDVDFIVDKNSLDIFAEWLKTIVADRSYFGNLPDQVKLSLTTSLTNALQKMSQRVEDTLRSCFDVARIHTLTRSNSLRPALSICIQDPNHSEPFMLVTTANDTTKTNIDWSLRKLDGIPVYFSSLRRSIGSPESWSLLDSAEQDVIISAELLLSVMLSLFTINGISSGRTYYLPEGRSTILQAWRGLTSAGLNSQDTLIAPGSTATPPLKRVVRDFLRTLLLRVFSSDSQVSNSALITASSFLQQKLLAGTINIQGQRTDGRNIMYQKGKLRIPLQQSSSMISELAPLDLWIRHVLVPGDLLIIDEPEAHLHPENQRLIARVLVRLVHAGIKVLITTHSSLILHQVSNLLAASQVDEETRQREGFEEADLIGTEDVGVYLFHQKRDGFHIRDVPIKPVFGISEDEFVRVAEEIGDESYRLAAAMPSSEENA